MIRSAYRGRFWLAAGLAMQLTWVSAQTPATPPATARAKAVAAPAPPPAPAAPLRDGAVPFALDKLLRCGDFDFLTLASQQQLQRLAAFAQLHCVLTRFDTGVGKIVCDTQAQLLVLGLPVSRFTLFDRGDEHAVESEFSAPQNRLRKQVGQFYGRPLQTYGDVQAFVLFGGKAGDCRNLVVGAYGEGARLQCRVQAPVYCPAAPAGPKQVSDWQALAAGSVSGRVVDAQAGANRRYRVCAVTSNNSYTTCTSLPAGQTQFRIADLPAGYYLLVASSIGADDDVRIGAHSESTPCLRLGGKACNDGRLTEVPVGWGQDIRDIEVNDFRNRNPDWPDVAAIDD